MQLVLKAQTLPKCKQLLLYLVSTSISQQSSYRTLPRAILANIFFVFHILLLFYSPKGTCNKLQNMENWKNISHTALDTVQ